MHLTDEQLNEYLDGEIKERAQVEIHLMACGDCAARLTALQALFNEIESLPELALSHDLAAPIARRLSGEVPLPRSLRLTVTLQAVAAVVAMIVAAPFVVQWISSYLTSVQAPSLADLFLQMQAQWTNWLDLLSQLQPPVLPEIPIVDLSSLYMILAIIGISLFWLIGNGLLLRDQMK